jgi:DNA-binding helix-hairpin-helix protein with protein kinase domain
VTRLHSGNGQWIEPGNALGRGGEGTVHELPGRPGFVAKIYHQPVEPDKAQKLEGMARHAHPGLLEIATWPVDVLRARPDGPLVGFVMARVNGYHEIHSLYGPSHRKRTFPHADWSFLVHAARNLASAFETIHARGHVIGDVNPGNVVVSAQALVKMIDCDSFQIDTGDRLFLCDVGVPQFTPPELQDQSFHGLRRTTHHDTFGLALLCFHLLFMGRHPFAGRYRGKGDMPIERAIKEYRFAFGARATGRAMEPPPNTLPLEALPQPIAQLFERAFTSSAPAPDRPTAREWRTALERLNRELRVCTRNIAHKYPAHTTTCPWCALEQASGTRFFGSAARPAPAHPATGYRDFQIDTVWSRILAVTPPPNEAMPHPTAQTPITPTPLSEPLNRARRTNLSKTVAIAGAVLLATLARPNLIWLWLLLGLAIWPFTQDKVIHRERQRRRLALLAARRELTDLQVAWRQRATDEAFMRKLRDLHGLRERYHNLAAALQKDLRRLETDQRQIQLQTFLENQFIDAAQIRGIGVTDRMALASYGIETAADVNATALAAVPGFGQRLGQQRAAALLAWRQALEQGFRHDPRQSVDPNVIADLQQHAARQRSAIERDLLAGPEELTTIKTDILKQRAQLNIALIRQAMQEAQAQADLRVFGSNGLALLVTRWRNRI